MSKLHRRPYARFAIVLLSATALSGCSAAERLSRVGEPPAFTPVHSPTEEKDYRPVTMPMPTPTPLLVQANSLWRPGARAFFKDERAHQVGDVLKVEVNIQNDQATIANDTRRTRQNVSETLSTPNLFNIASKALQTNAALGGAAAQAQALNATSGSDFEGKGNITRSETIAISLAAVVIQTLPNGNLAIAGRQEIRVNTEMRELQVAGVIRPEDIAADDSIQWNQIAEARIEYGGRGILSDVQQPRYGQQIFDILFPF